MTAHRFTDVFSGPVSVLAQASASFWFPPGGSTGAEQVDRLFFFILLISVIFFALVAVVMVAFVVMYRRPIGATAGEAPSHNTLLEILWSVIPAILVGVIFAWGFFGYLNMRQPPENCYEIQVVGKKWSWQFIYPNGYLDNNLHVPVDRPVMLVLSSSDVIHSLYIPAFRVKQDAVPGRYAKMWFEATRPGVYDLFCAEYCGDQHSLMKADVVVHRSGEFEKWLEEQADILKNLPPEEAGRAFYTRYGCAQCHSTDGSARVGPTFQGSFGARHEMAGGETVVVDENYIRESILEPQSKVRAGYKPEMPTYAVQFQGKEEEISAIIAFIKSLK